MPDVGQSVEIAGKAVGGGVSAAGALWFVRWLLTWLSNRFDARQDRLERREQAIEASYANRLRHLELAERSNQSRITILQQAVEILLAELRAIDGSNPKLGDVAELLRKSFAMTLTPADMVDMLKDAK